MMPKEPTGTTSLRYPWALYQAMLGVLKGRSRNQWIVEAMQEKLARETKGKA